MSVEGDGGSVPHTSGVRKLEGCRRVDESVYNFEGWTITVLKSPILPSNCYCSALDAQNSKALCLETATSFEAPSSDDTSSGQTTHCQVCRYSNELDLKHYPEMVFPDNILHLEYKPTGFVLMFNTLDAMKLMTTQDTESVRVACAEAWQASKTEMGLPKEIHHDFNWTFTTDYQGTLKRKDGMEPKVVSCEEKLNLQKLMVKEQILFFDEIPMFEDELHDNGISNLTIKIRVMPSGFFILHRYFLRVDHVMAKVCDTRFHYEVGNDFVLREVQIREESFKNLSGIPQHIFADINLLYNHLPVRKEVTDKLFM